MKSRYTSVDRRFRAGTLSLALWSALLMPALAAKGEAQALSYEATFESLVNLVPDTVCAKVSCLKVARDAGLLEMVSGELIPAVAINGRVRALIFKGEGKFSFAPSLEVERKQLARFYGAETLNADFNTAIFLFTDATFDSLRPGLRLSVDRRTGEKAGILREAIECLAREKEKYCHPHLMKGLLDDSDGGFFWAEIRTKDFGPLFFSYDPLGPEEIGLSRLAKGLQFKRNTEVICQFPASETGRPVSRRQRCEWLPASVSRYRASCTIDKDLNTRIGCTVFFTSNLGGQSWIPFFLGEKLELDSACWGEGQAVPAFKKKDNPVLWIRAPQPLARGQACSASVFYHGDIIDKQINWFFVRSASSWYPQTEYWERALFEVSFRVNEKFDFVSSFTPCTTYVEGDWRTIKLITEEPYRNFGFTLGYFDRYTISDPRIPRVEVLYTDESSDEKRVGADVANSLAFCQQIFGPCKLRTFSVTEYQGWGGVAYPGLINLSWATFQRLFQEGYDEMLRAHEVSHQWWGVSVDFETYHDQWLCEGLASFSGLLYLQKSSKDKKRYFEILKDWRDELVGVRKYALSSGRQPGPIWLGYRNNTSETEDDFSLMVYLKGAWVFHMLRNLMLDLNTLSEEKFTLLMSDFYSTYSGRSARTADFQAMAETHYGQKLDWFFDQWIRGTGIPRYKYALDYRNEAGKYRAVIKVRQEGVPSDFRMDIPLEFDFGDKRLARVRFTAQGPMTVANLPLLPLLPKKVTFNVYQSVLCTAEEVDWNTLN